MNNTILIRCQHCNTLNRVLANKLLHVPKCGKCQNPLEIKFDPIEATDMSFNNEVINNQNFVVVDFWASWCGPCKMFAPIFKQFANENAGRIKAVKVNVEQNTMIASQYQISAIPTLVIFKNGKIIDRLSGAVTKSQLENFVFKHL